MKIDAQNRLIVALDLDEDDTEKAEDVVEELASLTNIFKVGLVMQLVPGIDDFIRSLLDKGKQVFLDYKYYDVEKTVRLAVARASRLGVSFLTVHGSPSIISAAVQGKCNDTTKLLAVTVLTSMDQASIEEMGIMNHSVEELVLLRAENACNMKCDGVIASGLEAEKIKERCGRNFLVVTPGIRPEGYASDHQKRRVTPTEAIHAGADYLVVGSPILNAPNHRKATEDILAEMQFAFNSIYGTK